MPQPYFPAAHLPLLDPAFMITRLFAVLYWEPWQTETLTTVRLVEGHCSFVAVLCEPHTNTQQRQWIPLHSCDIAQFSWTGVCVMAAHVSADPLLLACGLHWQVSTFSLSAPPASRSCNKTAVSGGYWEPPSTCPGISSSLFLHHPSASSSETGICWGTLVLRPCQMARICGGSAYRGNDPCGFFAFLFPVLGECAKIQSWAWVFINHLVALSCANNWSSDASKQHLFTCRASLDLRGQTLLTVMRGYLVPFSGPNTSVWAHL